MFVDLANSMQAATQSLGRERELFPLPIISADYIGKRGGVAPADI